MAKPYSIYKTSNGIYYAEILLPNGKHANKKSTGCRNREDAERTVMEWLVNGNIPERTNGKKETSTDVDKISFFNNLRNNEFSRDDVKKIIGILKDRKLVQAVVMADTPRSRSADEFVDEFWDWEKSPYIREKLLRGQSIHRDYCELLRSRFKKYWLPLIGGKSVGEITREDISKIFEEKTVDGLAAKTVNSIVSAITIPMKWAYFHGLTETNCHDGIIKCAGRSKKRKVLTMEQATAVFREEWENDSAKLANMLAFYTGMRQGEIAALRAEDIGADRIYIRHSWSKYEGLKETKTDEEREIKIPHELRSALLMQASLNPHGEGPKGFIFYGLKGGQPTDPKNWLKYLRRALAKSGYANPDEICFHSWRHLWCSRVSDLIQDKRVVMAGSGHRTEFMLNHYSEHMETKRALDRLGRAQERLFLPAIGMTDNNVASGTGA